MHFCQSPSDKATYVEALNEHQKVMMVGDGLNDAGALSNSYCGITVIEKSGSFSPACDGMLDAKSFGQLPQFISFAKRCLHRVYWSFAISMLYNVVGLTFAVQGLLKPIVAAIVMPMSSVSVVLFVTLVAPQLRASKKSKQ